MCGNSQRALRALHAAGAPVTTVDVLPDPRIRQELSTLSGWPTIPQVFVKGELIGGADITEELLASGELKQKLDEKLGTERAQNVKPSRSTLTSVADTAAIRSASSREIAWSPCSVRTVTGPRERRVRDDLDGRARHEPELGEVAEELRIAVRDPRDRRALARLQVERACGRRRATTRSSRSGIGSPCGSWVGKPSSASIFASSSSESACSSSSASACTWSSESPSRSTR